LRYDANIVNLLLRFDANICCQIVSAKARIPCRLMLVTGWPVHRTMNMVQTDDQAILP
jgi:hypothetical protein